jgi:CRP-like cAMP-binding protein
MTIVAPSSTDLRALIERYPAFAALPAETCDALVPLLRTETFRKDQVLFAAQTPGDCVYFLVDGEVGFFTRDRHGKPFSYFAATPGGLFGEIAFVLPEGKRNATAKALTDGVALVLDRDNKDAFVSTWPGALELFCRNMAETLRRNDQMIRGRATGEWTYDTRVDSVIAFLSGPWFLILNAVFVILWMGLRGFHILDEYPFNFLDLLLGMEALIVGALVLSRQQAEAQSERRDDVRHNEETRITLAALRRIEQHLNIPTDEPEI